MIHDLIHKITVVGNYQQAAWKIHKETLKHIKRHDIQIVSRLIENKEIWVLDQNCTQIESFSLATAQFFDKIILFLRSNKKRSSS